MAGEMLPDWQWKMPEGQSISVEDLRGQATVVVYWASWCPFCKNLFKGLDVFAKKYQQQGLRVLAVNVWDTADPIAFMQKFDYNFTILNEGEASAEAYGVFGTPTVFVLNPSGKVIYRTSNSNPHNPELENAILESLR
jgi:thiol-disulfide isomerase/thioredoxin